MGGMHGGFLLSSHLAVRKRKYKPQKVRLRAGFSICLKGFYAEDSFRSGNMK
jgi:hypothetical protein